MNVQNNYRKINIILFILGLALVSQASFAATATNRNQVFSVLENLNSNWQISELDVWVNENSVEPVVNVGDSVYFTMKASEPAYYTMIHVDSKGYTVVIDPMYVKAGLNGNPEKNWIFPSLSDKCNEYNDDPVCFDINNQFEQAEPIGKDTVFLLASKNRLNSEILGMTESFEASFYDRDLDKIQSLVARINEQTSANPISVNKYSYSVESNDTQYSTRAIKRKIKELEKVSADVKPVVSTVAEAAVDVEPDQVVVSDRPALVFNNINFDRDSADLSTDGRIELDGLGSVLVELHEETGEYPFVELTGHTDSDGPAEYNMELSANRALSAKRYLVREHGIPLNQIFTVGSGESTPVASNTSNRGKALNRRVEFNVVTP